MRTRNQAVGIGLVVLSAGCFILNAGVARAVLRAGVGPGQLTTFRVSATFAVFLVGSLALRRTALRPPPGRLLGLVLVHGAVGVAALQWTYFVALDRLPVGMALLLEYQAPVLVALWARAVQKQPVRPRLWLGLVLAIGGLAAATEVWQGARFSTVGIAGGLGAAVCFAAYFLIGEAGVSTMEPLRVVLWSFGVAAVCMNLTDPITGFPGDRLGDPASLQGVFAATAVPLWVLLAWIVVIGTVVPFTLILVALTMTRATTVTMVAMLEPIGVVTLGWIWFGERLGLVATLGCVAVVIGILVAQSARVARVDVAPPSLT